jgi:glycosyltransferase involved in cell wall biosynthesis
MLPALRRLGWDARFWGFLTSDHSSFAAALQEAGVPVSLTRVPTLRSPLVIRSLRSEIRHVSADIVHTHLFYGDVHGQLAQLGTRAQSVRTIHGGPSTIGRRASRWAFAMAGLLADRTIAVSQSIADMVSKMRFAPPSRIRVVRHGINVSAWASTQNRRTEARRRLGLGFDDLLISCTSRLIEGKGQDTLIHALAVALRSDPRLTLVVAGTGPDEDRLHLLAREMLPASSYRFVGFKHDLRPVLWASDIYVLPTHRNLDEAFGLTALEAMASGVPVIASDLPALRELVGPTPAGKLVAPGDVRALSDALERLASSATERSRLSLASAERASRFTTERMVQETLGVYRELLG